METTLHQQLKSHYAADGAREVALDGFRIDAVAPDGALIEIQCASLAAIRSKVRRLLRGHDVLVVKPVTGRKRIIKRSRKRGRILSRRMSPLRGRLLDVFEDLVHFVPLFPHPRLTLELVLVEIEEYRLPPLRRRWTRKRYRVEDRTLIATGQTLTLRGATDLNALLPDQLTDPFTTSDLAVAAEIPRWLAQKIAYCLRKTRAAEVVDKQGNALVYVRPEATAANLRQAG